MPPPAPAVPPTPELAELADLLGAADTRDIVRTYVREFPLLYQRLADGSREEQHRAAHSLKSSARQMGDLTLFQRLADLEARLLIPGATVTPADLAAISADFGRNVAALRAYGAGT